MWGFVVFFVISIFEENVWVAWLAVVLIGIGIFVISSVPEYGVGDVSGSSGNLAIYYHFFAFFFFGFFLMIACVRGRYKMYFVWAVLISVLYGVLDEVHQIFVPGRVCSFGDVLVDCVGVGFAFVFYFLVIWFRGNRKVNF